MKKLKIIAVLSLIMVTSIVMVACKKNDDKIPDPGGEFEYNRVQVILTVEASVLEKVWAPSDFPEFAFSEIDDSGLIGNQRFLIFHLMEPSRNNVLRAVYYLRTRPEIYLADLSGIIYPGLQ